MSKFNEKKETNKTTNLAGGKAFKRSPEMELIFASLTTFLGDKFYESGEERSNRIENLVASCNPEFVAKLAVVARTEFHLRSVSHLLIGKLSKIHRGDDLVRRAMKKAVIRPDDMTEIVAYVGKPIPKQVKRGIRASLPKFSRYQLAKYRMENKKVSLVDLFNLAHPKPRTAEQKKDWKDLMTGKLKNTETWEAKKSAGGNFKELVLEGKIPYMALLRNLRNIDEENDELVIKKACKMISDRDSVKKSKQLPFRFWTAYMNVDNQKMRDAISQAMEHSLDNVPKFDGKTLVAVDCSGSMGGRPIEIASVFASALAKANGADVVLYSEEKENFRYVSGMPILAMAEKIQSEAEMGGTNTSLVFQTDKKYDRVIILSDNESWQDSHYHWGSEGFGTQATYNTYKKETGCDPFVYAVDIEGYGTSDVKGNKVFHLTGWSDKMFDFMKHIEKSDELIEYVKAVEL